MSKTPPKTQAKPRLDFIRPRETRRIQRARDGRVARVIKKLRLWLPGMVGLIVLLLILWPVLLPNFTLSTIAKNVPDLVIDNLHYTGLDSKNQPYSLLASQATRPNGLHGIYDLTKPEGDITLQSGAWMDGKADLGRYDEIGHKLWLGGNVRLFHERAQVTTEEAQVDLNTDDAWGDKPVLIQGNFGTIRGTGFRFLDSGHEIVIEGPAKAVLSLHGSPSSDKPNALDNGTK